MLKLLKIRNDDGIVEDFIINESYIQGFGNYRDELAIYIKGTTTRYHSFKEGYKLDSATLVKQFNASNIVDLDICEYKEIVKRS